MNRILICFAICIAYNVFSLAGSSNINTRVICKWDVFRYATTDKSKVAQVSVKETDFTGCEDAVFDGFSYDPYQKTFQYSNYQATAAVMDGVIQEFKQLNGPNLIITFQMADFNSYDSYDAYVLGLQDTQLSTLMRDYLKQHGFKGVLIEDYTQDEDIEIFKCFIQNAYSTMSAEGILVYTTLKNSVEPLDQAYIDQYVFYTKNSDLLLMRGCYPPDNSGEQLLMNFQSLYGAKSCDNEGCFGDGCAIASVVNQLKNAKVDVKKLALPITTICVMYKLKSPPTNCIGTPIVFGKGPIWNDYYTAFYETCYCQKQKKFGQDTIFSCTDRPLAAEITQYAMKIGAGGVCIDSLNYEDPKGSLCTCREAFPIKNTVVTVTNGGDISQLKPCLDITVNPIVASECCKSAPQSP